MDVSVELPERIRSGPSWIETAELSYPSGRSADEVVVRDAAQLIWVVNLGCIDLNPHPVRADDLEALAERVNGADAGGESSNEWHRRTGS